MQNVLGHKHLRILLAILVLQAGIGLLALEGYKVAHCIFEPNCPAQKSGNPADCLICAHYQLLPGESTPELAIPSSGELITLVSASQDRWQDEEWQITPSSRSPPGIS